MQQRKVKLEREQEQRQRAIENQYAPETKDEWHLFKRMCSQNGNQSDVCNHLLSDEPPSPT